MLFILVQCKIMHTFNRVQTRVVCVPEPKRNHSSAKPDYVRTSAGSDYTQLMPTPLAFPFVIYIPLMHAQPGPSGFGFLCSLQNIIIMYTTTSHMCEHHVILSANTLPPDKSMRIAVAFVCAFIQYVNSGTFQALYTILQRICAYVQCITLQLVINGLRMCMCFKSM